VITTGVSYAQLTWGAPASDGGATITNYLIYRGTSSGGETLLAEIADVLNYNDTDVTNGVEYFYRISARNIIGEGDLSNEASGIPFEFPGAPTNMAIQSGDGYIYVSWAAPASEGSSSIVDYIVYRGTASETETFLAEIGNVLFYNDTLVTNGVTYYYYVIARNNEGDGPHGDEVSAMPLTIPGMATDVAAEKGDTFVDLSWDAPASDGGSPITNYRIYRGTTSGALTLLVEVGDILTYNDTTVSNGVTYFYTITCVNAVGESPQTTEIIATPFRDTDGDLLPDHQDADDDNDGIPDTEEDENGNGIVDSGETDPLKYDTDSDGYNDKEDAFPTDPSKWNEEEPESGFLLWIIILVLIIVVVLVLFLATRKKGKPKDEIPPKVVDEGPKFEASEEPETTDELAEDEDLPPPDDEDLPPPDDEDLPPPEDEEPMEDISGSDEPQETASESEEPPAEDVEPSGGEKVEDMEPSKEETVEDEKPVNEEKPNEDEPPQEDSDSQEKLDQVLEDITNGESTPDKEITE
jgi:hypothetical protein